MREKCFVIVQVFALLSGPRRENAPIVRKSKRCCSKAFTFTNPPIFVWSRGRFASRGTLLISESVQRIEDTALRCADTT